LIDIKIEVFRELSAPGSNRSTRRGVSRNEALTPLDNRKEIAAHYVPWGGGIGNPTPLSGQAGTKFEIRSTKL
jgi:hypothetical protein